MYADDTHVTLTSTNVEELVQKLNSSIFLDLKKAFDTVDHKILLEKLRKYGIRENARDWFES